MIKSNYFVVLFHVLNIQIREIKWFTNVWSLEMVLKLISSPFSIFNKISKKMYVMIKLCS